MTLGSAAPSPVEGYVHFDGISFGYPGHQVDVLRDVNLSIRRGEFFMLLGPSGCGKTTMLNLLAGFEHPTSGEVVVDHRTIVRPGPDRLVIFQGEDSLLGWLTTQENVEFGLRVAGVAARERRHRADQALQLVGLEGQGRKYPHQLSGGMKQRVQIARALVCDAGLLLMDEPFAALDAQTRAALQDELARIWEETHRTILFITHDISEAIILGDRIGVMRAGPASGLKEVVDNNLDRPRHRGDALFAAMYARVEQLVAAEVKQAMQRESH